MAELNPDRIVNVRVSIRSALGAASFGHSLFLNDITGLVDTAAEHRLHDMTRTYGSLLDLQNAYTEDNVYDSRALVNAASIYFSQVPYPKPLVVGNWFRGGRTGALLNVAPAPDAATSLGALANNNQVNLTLAGTATGAIDFSADTTLNAIAARLQNGLATVNAGIRCEAQEDGIDIIVPAAIANLGPMTATPGTAAGMTASNSFLEFVGQANPQVYPAIAANEAGNDALARLARVNSAWYFAFARAEFSSQADGREMAQWARANRRLYCGSSNDRAVLLEDDANSNVALESAAGNDHWACLWHENEMAGAAVAAKLAGWDLDSPGAGFTLDSKTLGGLGPSDITSDQADALESKRVSYYAQFGADSRVVGGYVFGSDWADVIYWTDWFQARVQESILRTLKINQSVPYTNAGMDLITASIARVCEDGVSNGGIAPGQLTEALSGEIRARTANPDFNGYLNAGYFIWHGDADAADQADRDARTAPPISVWLNGAGAIHRVTVNVTFEG